ncbi:gamma-glutamylcyclotransferase [Aliidiomarina sanyensis]|uniref:glutathione-specific gamma-glutamylcyclotransferase n=1 Tax=Aliidiomarina sanyensis TaxID=1249555 RepID=A0A432WPT4_9GAMM|nr:gamma-glutamylcyclotransferase [Aliidiomarina sanyensis]RUO35793.1 gamma-glutamylcyclotransferase [Aliidiomarina sanyensis]
MPHDTQAINKNRQNLEGLESVWVFGYGSLIFKADFPYIERRAARIDNWQRRFWQGSHDHRGTPEAPGRVLTLVEVPGTTCRGMAYKVTPDVFAHLDHREKNGYLRFETAFHFDDGTEAQGLVYIATEENEAWLGPASEHDIAAHIAKSEGPSGPNDEYVLRLAEALRAMDEDDPHVFMIADYLSQP